MQKVSFVQDGSLVVAPANYGLVDSSIGGQLARKMVPGADGRTRRGLAAINKYRENLSGLLKQHVKGGVDPIFLGWRIG